MQGKPTDMRTAMHYTNAPALVGLSHRGSRLGFREAGITGLTVGVANYGNGYQKSYYTWTTSGMTYSTSALDYVGRSKMDYYSMTIQPLEWYGNVEVKNNVADISLSTPHYLSVPKAVSVVGGQATMVQSAAYLTKTTCQGAEIFGTVGKAAGRISGAISIGTTAVSTYNRYEYLRNGGDNIGVAVVGATDVAFTIAGFFWPWGTIASAVYFSAEMVTDDFGGWGKIR